MNFSSLNFQKNRLEQKTREFNATDGNLLPKKAAIFDSMLTVEDLSEITKISVSGLYKLVHRGKIPHHKIGNSLRFSLGEVLESTYIQGK